MPADERPVPSIDLLKAVTRALRKVYDPEIPVNIVDLGLIYDIDYDDGKGDRAVKIVMTLTSPNCPVAEMLPDQVRRQALTVEDIDEVTVELTWDPPWSPDRMSEAAKLELEFTGHTGPAHLRAGPTKLTLNRGDPKRKQP
jgi:FeS assembly SUF system protein